MGLNTISTIRDDVDKQNSSKSLPLPVDLIRTVAIFLVVLLHASVESYNGLYSNYAQYITFWWASTIYNSIALPCVPLFIILAGALHLQSQKVNEPIRIFMRKRIGRIGVVFIFWSIVYFAWSYFADHIALTTDYILQSLISTGPYYHFWFIYLILGLYLITPVLRVIVARAEKKYLRYLMILWFIGVSIVPLMGLIIGFEFNANLFLIGGWIGYFVLGAYLLISKFDLGKRALYGFLILGFGFTILGSWLMTFLFHSIGRYFFFFDSLTANVILASIALYLILRKYPSDWPGNRHIYTRKIVQAISENTLPLYLFHVIILESLQRGYFGIRLSLAILNPFIEIPLSAIITLFITLFLILIMKKVPLLKRLIG